MHIVLASEVSILTNPTLSCRLATQEKVALCLRSYILSEAQYKSMPINIFLG